MMEKYEIQKLRELPIEKVAKEMGMKVEHHKALCPFHDDHHASLTFNKTKNSCRCYVCMRNSIGTIDLAMRYLGKDFPSACRWLALQSIFLSSKRNLRAAWLSQGCSKNLAYLLASKEDFPELSPEEESSSS